MASKPVRTPDSIRFGDDFEVDRRAYELRSAGIPLKLKPNAMELLLLLIDRRGELVTREQIVEHIWGKGVFLDTDNSINGAISKIRQVLRDDAEQPRFVQTVSGRGYRFIAPTTTGGAALGSESGSGGSALKVAEPRGAAQSGSGGERVPEKAQIQAGQRWKWGVVAGLAIVLAAGAAAYFLRWRTRNQPPASETRLMLAVLPFQNLTGDAGQEYFSDGLTEEMISQLGNLDPQHLGVIARTSVMYYKGSQTSLAQIGRELGVQYVIEGSVRRDPERVRISVQLIQMRDQSHIWARQYDRESRDLLTLQREIGQEIADEIQLSLGNPHRGEADRSAGRKATSYEVYDLYLKGLYFWNKRDLQRAVTYYGQAIAGDPNYARAYAGLANSYGLMSTWSQGAPRELMPKARTAALKALQLDEAVAEAHVALALVAENYDYDWPTAGKEFRRAIELDPNYAMANIFRG